MKLRKKPEDTGRHRIKLRKKPEETGKTRLRILLKFPIFKVKSREKPRKIPENPGKSREIPVKTGKMGKNDIIIRRIQCTAVKSIALRKL